MNPIASRLLEERNKWRLDSPEGFDAQLAKNSDGTLNLYKWECEIPGARNSPHEGGRFKLRIEFDSTQLAAKPNIFFDPVIFHPNVSKDGFACSTLTDLWPDVSIKQLLFALQSFLDMPNPNSALNINAADLYIKDRERYEECVRSDFQIL